MTEQRIALHHHRVGGCRSAFFFFFSPRDLLPPERSQRQLPLRPARVILLPNVQVLRHCEVCFHDVVFIFVPFAFLHRPRGLTTRTGAKKSTFQDRPSASMTATPSAVPAFFFYECFAKSGWARCVVALSLLETRWLLQTLLLFPPRIYALSTRSSFAQQLSWPFLHTCLCQMTVLATNVFFFFFPL